MQADFWHERWASNQLGFHQTEVNAHLRTHWSELDVEPTAPVFVPLCGKSLDLLWLRDQGFRVSGIEISAAPPAGYGIPGSLHILGYGIDPHDKPLGQALAPSTCSASPSPCPPCSKRCISTVPPRPVCCSRATRSQGRGVGRTV